ncbi:4F2 cell-surface antigen heavy chain isoform X2 [Paramormyrops kingsleyae]|nr:4F2 cell-surface antigen heavy chain-like isoform X2 [Paramormyrops kingsleyae]
MQAHADHKRERRGRDQRAQNKRANQKNQLHSEKMSLGAEGDPSSGSMAARRAAGSTPCGPGGSETVPLLISGIASNSRLHLAPMNKKELLSVVGSPGWRKLHALLGSLFWVGWLATVGVAIVVIAQSPNPAAPRLRWWQKAPFCRLQAALFLDSGHTGARAINEVRDRLPYLRNLGVGALILEGLFPRGLPAPAITKLNESLGTLLQFQQLLAEGHKTDMRILLDLCDLDFRDSSTLNSSDQTEESTNPVLTLLVWRDLMRNLSQEENERILVVSKAEETGPRRNVSDPVGNHSLVDMITRAFLPWSPRPLSAQDVAVAMETHLLRPQREWPSWTVGGVLPGELQNILMVLLMTLPGTPVISYGIDISPSQVRRRPGHSDSALFRSLSQLRSREEALILGKLTFLSLSNSSQTIPGSALPPSPPTLAFLCSWSCTRILVLLNLSPDIQRLDPRGVRSLPAAGVFLLSTGPGRLGSCVLETLQLQPWEAVVIKF